MLANIENYDVFVPVLIASNIDSCRVKHCLRRFARRVDAASRIALCR
jgi:hypothetical protein